MPWTIYSIKVDGSICNVFKQIDLTFSKHFETYLGSNPQNHSLRRTVAKSGLLSRGMNVSFEKRASKSSHFSGEFAYWMFLK
jgi:hypothetical protein